MTVRFDAVAGCVAAAALAGVLLPAVAAPAQRRAESVAAKSGDPLEAGAEAWEAQNYTRALGLWRPLAVTGNANAQYNLAQAYRLGRGVAVDQKIALDWYHRAAEQNHPQAQANYGLMLFQYGDRKAALPWLRKAADLGDPRAQYVVGTALFNGDVLAKDWVRAYAFMTRAAGLGLAPAQTSLAEMDRFMPLAQRQQGTALARDMARSQMLAWNEDNGGTLVRATPDPTRAPGAAPVPVVPTAVAAAAAPVPAFAAPAPQARPAPPVPKIAETAETKPKSKPASKPSAVASAAPSLVAAGKWRVQVGAYGNPGSADEVWAGIMRKAPGLGLRANLVKAGAVTRLQAGPLASRADANKACTRIKATGAACFPVSVE